MKRTMGFRMGSKRPWLYSITLGVMLMGILQLSASAEYQLYFVTPDALHLMVYHTPAPSETFFVHTITSPGGAETALVNGSGTVASHEVRIDAVDDAYGTWQWHVDRTLTNAEGVAYHDISDGAFDAGHAINGTMLFDEALGGEADSSNTFGIVNIYSDLTLTLNEGDYFGGHLNAEAGDIEISDAYLDECALSVSDEGQITASGATSCDDMALTVLSDGRLQFADNVWANHSEFSFHGTGIDMGNALGFSSCEFHYYTPPATTYEPLHREAGTVFLERGSEGASLEGTNYNITLLQGNETFDMEDVTLRIGCDASVTGLKDSSIIIGDSSVWPLVPVTNTIYLEDMTLSSLSITAAEYVDVTGCEITSTFIGGGAPDLTGNSFVGPVRIFYGGTATIQNNVFHDALKLISPPHDTLPGTPTIENNSFMGPSGIIYDVGLSTNGLPAAGSIVIGANYYGSPNGPSLAYTNTTHYGFLGDQGAQFGTDDRIGTTQHYDWFSIPSSLSAPATTIPLVDASPVIWKAGWAVGQGVLNWIPTLSDPMYKGVSGMVAFDVRSSQPCAADCYLENLTAGTTLRPIFTSTPLQREMKQNSSFVVQQGLSTVLFDVPPPITGYSAHFELHAVDEGGTDHLLQDGYLNFTNHPWVRPLRIAVVPVNMKFWLSQVSAPAGSVMQTFIKQTLPAIFPISDGKLVVDVKPKATMSTSVGMLSSVPGLGALAAKLSKKYVDTATNAYDLVVAVMPKGGIRQLSSEINDYIMKAPPAAGVNFDYGKYFWVSTTRILIVDSSTPMAYLHELGHAAGLYRDPEQYDMPAYKATDGKPLSDFSAGALRSTGLGWFPDRTRIAHFAPANASWYSKGSRWLDVMGLSERFTWPDAGTHSAIMDYFSGMCSSAAKSSSALNERTNEQESMDDGSDSSLHVAVRASGFTPGTTVVVGGHSLRIDESIGQQPMSEHAWAFDAAGIEEMPEEIVNGGNWYQHAILRFFNDSDTILSNVTFDLPSTQLDTAWWSYYTAMPLDCTRIQLLWEKDGESLIQDWADAGTLTVQIDEAQLSDPLDSRENLEWSITASDPATNSHLYSQVSYSLDDGTTWTDWDDPTEDDFLTFDTEFLPVSESIAFRVIVSDGFSMAQDTVTGLRILDRSPTVTIASPRANDVAIEDTVWPLTATAMDVEDGLLEVTWTSSRDGPLTTNTMLSMGSHTLTASVSDSAANTASAMVRVQVISAATETDLAIDSLELAGSTIDLSQNWSQLAPGMTQGETNWIECIIRNSGIATTGTLDVVVVPPSGVPESLPSESLVFAPFSSQRILLPVDATEYGVYTIEAEITPEENPDRSPDDNQASFETYTQSPVLMLHKYAGHREEQIAIPLDYFSPGQTASVYPMVYNGGSAPLSITSMTISNHVVSTPPSISINYPSDPPPPAVLLPGESLDFRLAFYAVEEGIKEATLHIASDDPVRPLLDVPVYGYAYPWDSTDNDWLDEDNDRLPTFVEELIGTDPDDPDSDDDGIVDGLEDRNGNGIQDPMETLALVADTDGDGLLDGEEDRNGNGGMDGDESSPLLKDTDEDTLSDFGESAAHTDWLNPESHLSVESITQVATNSSLQWAGKRGVRYQVQQSPDLTEWSLAPAGSGHDEQSDRTAERDEPLTYRFSTNNLPTAYERIVVLP